MRRVGVVRIAVAAMALALLWNRGDAQTPAVPARASAPTPAVPAGASAPVAVPAPPPLKPLRDGQHDFDFLYGKWKYHLKRLENPLTGATPPKWIEFDGVGECRPIWGGKANLDTLDVNGPSGHIEGLTLRTYNPESHQWSLYWSNAAKGTVDLPTVGSFGPDGKGEFYDQEPYRGRMIFVRYVWSATKTKSPHFEQSFSDDGGKTWEVNWITDQVRTD